MRASLLLFLLLAVSLGASPAAATIDAQSDGSDGALNVTDSDLTIDLRQAVTGSWNQPGTGLGVYDPTKWAVVFKYSSINIASGRTVKFINHPSNAPVVWLVQGIATIAGTVNLSGEGGTEQNRESVPGPGGFPGGRGTSAGSPATAGHGPGGGGIGRGAGYATVGNNVMTGLLDGGLVYGNASILPLLGGSGGGGSANGGGAGGGAILMVVGQRCAFTGLLSTTGGATSYAGNSMYSGSGSGGAIRIVADTLTGGGSLNARPGNMGTGVGRVRLEANVLGTYFSISSDPDYSPQNPLGAEGAVIWPPAPEPAVRIATVNGQAVTADPRMSPEALMGGDLVVSATTEIPVTLAATNVPTNATVTVRVVLGAGDAYTVPASFQSGDANNSIWTATLTSLSQPRVSSLQAKVVLP